MFFLIMNFEKCQANTLLYTGNPSCHEKKSRNFVSFIAWGLQKITIHMTYRCFDNVEINKIFIFKNFFYKITKNQFSVLAPQS